MNHALPTAAPDDCAGDRAGRPETRGIDQVPIAERHGRARELFAIWAAPNVSYLSFVIGATLVLMGLSPVQAIGVALVGNLLWILTGVVAISGPAAGTSGSVVSRAMYGVLGNRIVLVLTGWLIASAYLALNWSAASVAGIGLARRLGLPSSADSPNSASWRACNPRTPPDTHAGTAPTTGRGASAPIAPRTVGERVTSWTITPSWRSDPTGRSARATRAWGSPTANCDAPSTNRAARRYIRSRRSRLARPTRA